VTKLSTVGARNSHGHGYQVSLRYSSCEEYGSCGKKQEPPVQVSSRHPTLFACLEELLKRLQDRHVECVEAVAQKASTDVDSTATETPDAQNVLQTMMQLDQAKTRAKAANKVVLHVEKEKDTDEQEVERLQQLLQAKRARTHSTTASRSEVPTPKEGKTDPLEHSRLGLVGWIEYWSLGNCALSVKIIVGLIRKINLTLVKLGVWGCVQTRV
jgi:hypothetical protein